MSQFYDSGDMGILRAKLKRIVAAIYDKQDDLKARIARGDGLRAVDECMIGGRPASIVVSIAAISFDTPGQRVQCTSADGTDREAGHG